MRDEGEITRIVREMCKKKTVIAPKKRVSARDTEYKPFETKWLRDMFDDTKEELTEYLWRIKKL